MVPDLIPFPKYCINKGSNPWLPLKLAQPLIADLPVKAGCLKPSHFATTEFTPSHPTKTYIFISIAALISQAIRVRLSAQCKLVMVCLYEEQKVATKRGEISLPTLALRTVPSARCTSLNKPDSSMETTLDENLMVPFGRSFARASNNKFLFTQRTSWSPLRVIYNLNHMEYLNCMLQVGN